MWIIGGVLSFYLLQKLAALLAIGLFLLAVWMKSKISHMDGEKWDQYFRTLSNRGYTAVFFVFYTIPHLALGWVGYLLYSYFCFPAPAVLALWEVGLLWGRFFTLQLPTLLQVPFAILR